jgi:hypothetical protein
MADERKPSEVTDEPWLWAERAVGDYRQANENSGKWLVYLSVESVDLYWEKIRQATIEGRLGYRAKVATSMRSPLSSRPKSRVICVYTYDWTDADDVHRVREALRELGIKRPIVYKADADTLQGNTRDKWHPDMAKYRA